MTDAAQVTGEQTVVNQATAAKNRGTKWVQILVGIVVGADGPSLIGYDIWLAPSLLFAGFSVLLVLYALLAWRFGWQTPVRWWAMIIISVVHIGAMSYEVHQVLSNWSRFEISIVLGDLVLILPALGVIALLIKMRGHPMSRPRVAPAVDERILSVIDEPY